MKGRNFLTAALALALLASFALPAQAQRRRAANRGGASAQQRNQAEERRQFEEEVRQLPDQGTDLAFVFALEAGIHEEASATSPVLMRVKRPQALALSEREPQGGWLRVIHIDTATEGWIPSESVVVKYTAQESAGPPLEVEEVEAERSPELVVTNLEQGTDLNLRINGTLYVIRRNSSRTLTLEPGTYKYYGYSRGIAPARGQDTLQRGRRYSWTFQILRR
jgi:hypothetical protein